MSKSPDRIESSQTKERKVEKVILSSVAEQEAVLASSAAYLIEHTRNEVYSIDGPVDRTGLEHLDSLRSIVETLTISLGKKEEYSPRGWLSMGITEFIPQDKLKEWATPTEERGDGDQLNYANYFLNKERQKQSPPSRNK